MPIGYLNFFCKENSCDKILNTKKCKWQWIDKFLLFSKDEKRSGSFRINPYTWIAEKKIISLSFVQNMDGQDLQSFPAAGDVLERPYPPLEYHQIKVHYPLVILAHYR